MTDSIKVFYLLFVICFYLSFSTADYCSWFQLDFGGERNWSLEYDKDFWSAYA